MMPPLDRPPDPQSPWQRITIEEVMLREAAALHAWREATLAALDLQFQKLIAQLGFE